MSIFISSFAPKNPLIQLGEALDKNFSIKCTHQEKILTAIDCLPEVLRKINQDKSIYHSASTEEIINDQRKVMSSISSIKIRQQHNDSGLYVMKEKIFESLSKFLHENEKIIENVRVSKNEKPDTFKKNMEDLKVKAGSNVAKAVEELVSLETAQTPFTPYNAIKSDDL